MRLREREIQTQNRTSSEQNQTIKNTKPYCQRHLSPCRHHKTDFSKQKSRGRNPNVRAIASTRWSMAAKTMPAVWRACERRRCIKMGLSRWDLEILFTRRKLWNIYQNYLAWRFFRGTGIENDLLPWFGYFSVGWWFEFIPLSLPVFLFHSFLTLSYLITHLWNTQRQTAYLDGSIHHQRSDRNIIEANDFRQLVVGLFAQHGFVRDGLVDTIRVGLRKRNKES